MPEKEMDYFTALYDVAKVINASLEPACVLEEIVRSVAEAMRVKAGSLRILDERKKKLILGACHGLSSDYVHKGPVLVEESGIDQEALKGKVIWIEDAQTDPRFQYNDMARAEGIRSVLVVPLVVGTTAVGFAGLHGRRQKVQKEGDSLHGGGGQPKRHRPGKRQDASASQTGTRPDGGVEVPSGRQLSSLIQAGND